MLCLICWGSNDPPQTDTARSLDMAARRALACRRGGGHAGVRVNWRGWWQSLCVRVVLWRMKW